MDLKETYNKIAKEWEKDHHDDTWWVEGTNKFISLLPKKAWVLDIGCGAGIKSKHLSDSGINVAGIDFSEKQLEVAKQRSPKSTFYEMDFKNASKNFKKESFDGLFMQASLLHIPRTEAPELIENLSSLLKEKGLFYIAVKGKWFGRPEEEIRTENDYGYEYERFFSYFDMDEIKDYLNRAGLRIIHEDIQEVGKTKWIQVIGRK